MAGFTQDDLKLVENGALVPPVPPFEGEDRSEALWRNVSAFLRRWVKLPDERLYAALSAYVLLTWRRCDARFPHTPILRISGPPGSGKGRVLECLKMLVWRGLAVQTTPDNLHWFVEHYGDATQLFDEFHTSRGRSKESQERLVDVLNFGYERGGTVARVVGDKLRAFGVAGARVLCGYSQDEHEAMARRSLTVRMEAGLELPEAMDVPALPLEFYREAAQLRGRLLAWRGRKYLLGMPDAGERWRELRRRAGREVAQALWPIAEMVPSPCKDELEAIMPLAEDRKRAVQDSRAVDLPAFLLAEVARLIESGQALEQKDGGAWIVPTMMLVDRVADTRANITAVPKLLGPDGAGLAHGEFRLREPNPVYGARPKGFKVPKDSTQVALIMRRHGVEWPPALSATECPV